MKPYLNHSVTTHYLCEGFFDFLTKCGSEVVLDGERPQDVDDVLGGLVGGNIEAVQTLATYADLLDGFEDRLAEADFPGVLQYEVVNPMGWWFAQYTIDTFMVPSREAFLLELGDRINSWLGVPTCDVCGALAEDESVEWCGNCGNCSAHCLKWEGCA
jgi:hypothetical protein